MAVIVKKNAELCQVVCMAFSTFHILLGKPTLTSRPHFADSIGNKKYRKAHQMMG